MVANNVFFTQFPFAATGAPTPRTQPDRLAEIKNVKDFGAQGNGSTDDTSAIQAAINWTTGPNRGTIYFPLGQYPVSSPLTFNYNGPMSIRFLGESSGSSILAGMTGQYVFDRHLASPVYQNGGMTIFEKLQIENNSGSSGTGGAIRLGSTVNAYIRDCLLSGYNAFTAEDSVGNSSQNILFENVLFSNSAATTGSQGVVVGGSGAMMGCDYVSFDVAVVVYGKGFHLSGNRNERSNTGYQFGCDSAGNPVGASGFSLTSGTCEGNWISIDIGGPGLGLCQGFLIGPVLMEGHDSTNAGAVPGIKGTQTDMWVRANCAQAGVFHGVEHGNWADIAGIQIDGSSTRANNLFIACTSAIGGGTGTAWVLPSTAQTAQFVQCNVQPTWTFSQLPSGANVFEGDEFNISDSPVSTWGSNVTAGGGSTPALLRWNGTNWTVVGK